MNLKFPAIFILVIGINFFAASQALSRQAVAARTITAQEKAFAGPAMSYLGEANSLGNKVAHAMNGLNDGSSTLGDVKKAMSRAKFVEGVSYQGDYLAKTNGVVPAVFAREGAQIAETHRLFQSAMRESLKYWKDSNTAHIVSGTATFKKCVLTMNSAMAGINAKLKKKLKPN